MAQTPTDANVYFVPAQSKWPIIATIALLVVSYFYEWQYDPQWPPTQSNRGTSTPSTYPELGLATLDAGIRTRPLRRCGPQ